MTEFDEIQLTNAGAAGLAMQLLKDDGRGEMPSGPCADALAQWRRMREALGFYAQCRSEDEGERAQAALAALQALAITPGRG